MANTTSNATLSSQYRSRLIERTPFFYGWIVLIAGTLGSVMMGPSQTYTISLFIDTYITEFGLSRATVSLLYGVATLGASLMLPITGRLVDRYGPRKMMVVVSSLFVLSCVSMSLVMGVVSLLLALLMLRFLGFGSMQLVSNNAIAQWFVRRRGTVMGLAGQALAVSLLIWPPLAERLIQNFSWRAAWIGISLLVLVIAVPMSWLFFRDRPELYGQRPDGDGTIDSLYPDIANEDDWTLSEAVHTGVFWIFMIAFMLMSTVFAGLVFHQASLFAARGLDRQVAVHSYQVMALVSIIGNLAMGFLLDKVSARLLLVIVLGILSASVWLIATMQTPLGGALYAAFMGTTVGGYRVMDATIWAKYFGRRYLGSIRGATMVGTVGGTALGALPLGICYDMTGSYTPALMAFAVLPLAISALMIFVKRPSRPIAAA